MIDPLEYYFAPLAAAFVRGKLGKELARELVEPALNELSEDQFRAIIRFGLAAELRLNKFKRTMDLTRVTRILGMLQSFRPTSLLDVGSGRGAFLWPLLNSCAYLPIMAIDRRADRVADIQAVSEGGYPNLSAVCQDITALTLLPSRYDIVTMLEVLEHIEDPQAAINNIVAVAERFILLSVPTKADDNPEHLHLFNESVLTELFINAGVKQVRFNYLLNHVIAIAKIASSEA